MLGAYTGHVFPETWRATVGCAFRRRNLSENWSILDEKWVLPASPKIMQDGYNQLSDSSVCITHTCCHLRRPRIFSEPMSRVDRKDTVPIGHWKC